jgi:hypothetical protein
MSDMGVKNMGLKESWTEVRKNLKALNEDQLTEFLIQKLSQVDGYSVFPITSRHVPGEHGKDIVASYKDPMGVEFCCYFQIKVGDINANRWRSEIKPQLEAMLEVGFDLPIAKEDAPIRRILVYTGHMTSDAQRELAEYRKTHHPRVELWDINHLVRLAQKTTDLRELKAHVHLLFNIREGKMPQFSATYFPQEFGRQALEAAFSSEEIKEKLIEAYDMSDIKAHAKMLEDRSRNILLQLGEWLVLYWLRGESHVGLAEEFYYVNQDPKIKQMDFDDLPIELTKGNDLLNRLNKAELKGLKSGLKQFCPDIPDAFSLISPDDGVLLLQSASCKLRIKVEISGQGTLSSMWSGGWGRYGNYMGLPLHDYEEKKLMKGLSKLAATDFRITLSKEPGLALLEPEFHSLYEQWIEGLFKTFRPWFDWECHAEQRSKGSEFDEIKNMLEIIGYNLGDIREALGIGGFRTRENFKSDENNDDLEENDKSKK